VKKGYGLLAGRLYLPEIWFSPEYAKRRKANWVPEDLTFQTKLQIALELIQRVVQNQAFSGRWIGCDATFGSDIHFLESLPKDYYYFADVRSHTQVFLKKPRVQLPSYAGRGRRPKRLHLSPNQPQPQTVADIARSRKCCWQSVILAEGAKGPIVAQVARLLVYPSAMAFRTTRRYGFLSARRPMARSNFPSPMPRALCLCPRCVKLP